MKKKFIRKTICILLMAVLSIHILLLTACGGGEAPSDTTEGEITVADLCLSRDGFLSGRVIAFANENPSYGIQYVHVEKDSEKERIMMDTVNGGGPDLLYVYIDEVENLAGNDVLGEIGQLISEENKKVLLPAAVAIGTIEADKEGMYAVPLMLSASSLLTSKDYWQGESWTVEDVLSILKENPGLEGIFMDMGALENYYYNMSFLVGRNLRNTPFLKDGKSNFDCQEFRDVLKAVKDRTKPQMVMTSGFAEDRLVPLIEGRYLGIEFLISNMNSYCNLLELIGDKGNLVGYPNDQGNGHYLSASGVLVVRQSAMEKEGVRELVNNLLSLESQRYVTSFISVREDIPEDRLGYSDFRKRYVWKSPKNNGGLLMSANAGDYLEEYLEFLKGASADARADEVFDIIMEEADYYFDSAKELDEVVDTIQRRVALYMSERE